MAGLGLDGQVMAGTNEKVKAVVGWVAYVFSGLRQIFSRGFRVDVARRAARGDGERANERDATTGRAGTRAPSSSATAAPSRAASS